MTGRRPALLRAAERGAGLLAALGLAAMGAVTVVDVAGRYLWNAPLAGSYELVQLLLAVTVFAALPLATGRREHVGVDLLDPLLPGPVLRAAAALTALLSALALALLAWQLALRGVRLAEDRARTNLLGLPLGPLAWLMAAASAASVPGMLGAALAAARGRLASGAV